MDLEMIIVSEVSQTEEDEYVTYIWHQKKKRYKWAYLQNRNRLTLKKQIYG